jgi:EmrB/QacA subfamily drug resistance transporter
MPAQSDTNPFAANPWACLAVSATGTFMATLDGGIVNVALPVIAHDFSVNIPLVQWVISAYLLTISCLLPVFGHLGDMTGRKSKYRLGFALFALASAMCGLAGSIWLLILARAVQAVGAAMLMANGPAIVVMSFPGPQRGRALGMVGMVVSLGSLAGPAAGGALLGLLGWPWLFYINVPIGLFGVYLAERLLPDDSRESRADFDYLGTGIYSVGIISLLLAVSHGGEWGWDSWPTLCFACSAAILLPVFLLRQTKLAHPVIDLALFRIRSLAVGNLTSMLSFMGLFANTIMLPFFLVRVAGLSPGRTGLLMAVLPLVMAVAAPLSGYFSEKISPALLTGLGLLITSAALYSQSNLAATSGQLRVALGQGALGLGLGTFIAPNNNAVLGSAPRSKAGVAGSLMALVRNLGMVCGIALATAMFEGYRSGALAAGAVEQAAFLRGFRAALCAGAVLTGLGGLLAFVRGPRPDNH